VLHFIDVVPYNVFVVARGFAEVVLPELIFKHLWVIFSLRLLFIISNFFLFLIFFRATTLDLLQRPHIELFPVILILYKMVDFDRLLLHSIYIIGHRLNFYNVFFF
jgi:hypothetical protein